MECMIGRSWLLLKKGDITVEDVDVIVNAANSSLMGGGGVDGAIHRAGGPKILEECKQIRQQQGDLPTGEAVITTGGKMKARHVIHTVGPVWHGGTHNEDKLLANAYRNSLRLADSRKLKSIAFPSISTGIYGFPIDRASRIAFNAVAEFLKNDTGITEVRFIVFSKPDFDAYMPLFGE